MDLMSALAGLAGGYTANVNEEQRRKEKEEENKRLIEAALVGKGYIPAPKTVTSTQTPQDFMKSGKLELPTSTMPEGAIDLGSRFGAWKAEPKISTQEEKDRLEEIKRHNKEMEDIANRGLDIKGSNKTEDDEDKTEKALSALYQKKANMISSYANLANNGAEESVLNQYRTSLEGIDKLIAKLEGVPYVAPDRNQPLKQTNLGEQILGAIANLSSPFNMAGKVVNKIAGQQSTSYSPSVPQFKPAVVNQTPTTGQRIKVISPEGKTGTILMEEWKDAQKQGFRRI